MADLPEDVVEQVKSWDRGQIGDHIQKQLRAFTFKTWADWHRHATEICTLCKLVLCRITELGIALPEDDMPIAEVIAYFQKGRTSRPPIEKLIEMIERDMGR